MHREFLARLASSTPLLPGVGQVAFVDVDLTHRRVYGRAKQGAEVGRLKGQRTLHPILATLSTPLARPVVAAVRLRRGKAADARGAAPFTGEAFAAARHAGASGTVVVRADSRWTAIRYPNAFVDPDTGEKCGSLGDGMSRVGGLGGRHAL